MSRIIALVDGFNLYHALDAHRKYHRFKWLSLWSLASRFVRKQDTLEGVFYFTAIAPWNQEKAARHREYIRALESTGVQTVHGEFKRRDRRCPLCGRSYKSFEEKQTDVNIALHLFQLAVEDRYDTVLLISGDSDLIPSLEAVRRTYPAKRIGVILPIGRASESLKLVADFHMKMKEMHLESSQFPDTVALGPSRSVSRPPKWS